MEQPQTQRTDTQQQIQTARTTATEITVLKPHTKDMPTVETVRD